LWTPGIPGGIPSRTAVYTTLSPTGDSTDRTDAINTALSTAGANQVVYLNAGTYYISGTITIPSNKVLRGAGMTSTILYKTGSGKTVVGMGSGMPWGSTYTFSEWKLIASGFGKDSYDVIVSDASNYAAGQLVLVTQADTGNGDIVFGGCTWGKISGSSTPMNDYCSIGQINRIESVSGNTITLEKPLYYEYDDALNVSIGRSTFSCTNAGAEEFTVTREAASTNSNDDDAGELYMGRASFCWFKNIKLNKVSGPGVNVGWGYCNTVHGCDLEESWYYDSGGGGYLMMIKLYSSNILIENNIFRQGNAGCQFDVAGAGSVYAYNFSDCYVTGNGNGWMLYDVAPHCSTPHMLLVEGSHVSLVENDSTHGNAIYWTLLRNWCDARHTEVTSPLDDQDFISNRAAVNFRSQSKYWTVVGNVLGKSGDTYGAYQADVNGSTTAYIYRYATADADTLIRHGNYDYYYNAVKWGAEGNSEADLQGTTYDEDLPDSLYLTSKPSWFGNLDWPCIGPDITGYVQNIPAYRRYLGESYPYSGAGEIEQEGARFRRDDGDEDEATWYAAQDENAQMNAGAKFRLRFLLNSAGDVTTKNFQLDVKKGEGGTYREVE
jgi:hypothetical protein